MHHLSDEALLVNLKRVVREIYHSSDVEFVTNVRSYSHYPIHTYICSLNRLYTLELIMKH